jgi:hypothetical protein
MLAGDFPSEAGKVECPAAGTIKMTAPFRLEMIGEIEQLTADFVDVGRGAAAEVVDRIGGRLT